MKSLKKKGFSLIGTLFGLAVFGIIASQALPNYAAHLAGERKQAMAKDIVAYTMITEKILKLDYYAPSADFTSTSLNSVFTFTTDEGETYKYPMSTAAINFKQYRILDPESEVKNEEGEITTPADYLSYGIILKFSSDNRCLVYNKIYDAKSYWSSICDPDNLNWDYES